MHTLNGNSQAKRTNQLPKYMRELASGFDGPNWNALPARKAPPPPPPVAIEDVEEEEAVPRRKKKSGKGKNSGRGKPMQIDDESPCEEDNLIKWNPNPKQTIIIEQSNRHGKRLESDEIEEIRRDALERNVAIILQTECRISREKSRYLEMKYHHSFFATPTEEQRINEFLKKHYREQLTASQDPLNTETKQAADLILNQQREKLKLSPDQFWKGGVALYINDAVFPVAQELESSHNHILVQITDLQNQKMLLLAVYGPANSAPENNRFFEETISQIHEKYEHLPILQIGDHNACFSLQKDLAPTNSPPRKQTSKTAFELMAHSTNLRDLRRDLQSQPDVYTFEKNIQNGKHYRANLDYFVVNQKWQQLYGHKVMGVAVAETPPEGYDHKPLTLELAQRTKKVKQAKQKVYIRQLNEEQLKELNALVGNISRDEAHPILAITQLRHVMTKFQQEHLDREKVELEKGENSKQRHKSKLTVTYLIAQKKAQLTHKAAILAASLEDDDVVLDAESLLDKRDTSVKARLARSLRKLRDLGEPQLATPGPVRARWIEELGKARKRFSNAKRALLRKMQRNRIQSHVRELIESFATEPRKFYRKIRNMLNKQAPGLTAVYTKDEDGEKVVSSDPSTVRKEAQAFYTQLYTSRGPGSDAFDNWLTPKTPSPESTTQLQRPVTKGEIREAVRELANHKACGEDNLPAELYKALSDNERFTEIMLDAVAKLITGEERIPPEWRLSHMILLHKNGDKYDISNYRPITLINVIYKTYSTILTKRLSEFVERNNFLHHSQCGFRPGRSTAHKLLAIDAFLREAQTERKEAHIVSIDIKKAYDSIEHWIIRKTLGRGGLNLPLPFLNAIMDTLENTSIEVRVAGGLSEPCTIGRGVRQGDPISPLLFNIAIDPLLRRLEERNQEPHDLTGPHAYADDVDLAYFSHTALEQAWTHVTDFLRVTHLEVNAKKTTYIRNQQAEEQTHEAALTIDGHPLAKMGAKQPFRVLGVHFTTELDWTYEKSLAAAKFTGALRNIVKRAVTDIQLIEIVNVMQLSALSYGMVVVPYTHDELKRLNETLHSTIRRRLRIATDLKGWDDWMTLKREEGGFGVYNIRDLHDANHVNGLMMVMNGPDTPAKRALTRHTREHSESMNEVQVPESTALAHTIDVIQRRGATLHTDTRNVNPHSILNQITDSKLLRDWKTMVPIENPTPDQIARLLLKERRPQWNLRSAGELQHQLNQVSHLTELTLTIKDAQKIHTAVGEAITRLKVQPLVPSEVMRKLRDDEELKARLGEMRAVLEQAADTILHQPREKVWTAKTMEEVASAIDNISPEERNEVMLPPMSQEQQNALRKLLQRISETAAEGDRTSDMRGTLKPSNRLPKIEMFGVEWEVSFTDGSRKTGGDGKERAGWGAFLPQDINKSAQAFNNDGLERPGSCYKDRVEGPQTNQRAELAAIYAALRAKQCSKQNQLIVTDSESSIKLLRGWKYSFSSNVKRKCRNRDLVRLIMQAEDAIDAKVELIHIFSHQSKAEGARKAKIAAQRAEYGVVYDKLVAGNEAADRLAGRATDMHPKPRDWATTPMRGVDVMYIVHEHNFVDAAPHSWIKEGTQKEILERQSKSAKARAEYLKLMPLCDKKRSFAAGARNRHASHATYVTLAKLRFHAAPTAEKNHRRHATCNADNPYRKFFQHLYPDDKCHACAKAGASVVEDTKHMLSCTNRPERNEEALKLWNEIYHEIEKNQSQHAQPRSARELRPFALRTQEVLQLYSPGAGGGRAPAPALARVAEFPDAAASLGLVPKDLEAALQELGVEKAGELADKVAAMVQSAVAADVKSRHRVIATDRGQKLLFRVHVLGSSAPQPA
jgi:ribonuclease HI